MKARRIVSLGLVVIMALGLGAIVWARAFSHSAVSFDSNGAAISGWHWLRRAGHTATWTFDTSVLQGAKKGSVFINFNPLCTNGVNGGSGYDTSCKLVIEGARSHTTNVKLVNPYRPIDPDNSGGVGYQCYGHSASIPSSVWQRASTIKVTVSYPFPSGRHVAVNSDCMSLGCSK